MKQTINFNQFVDEFNAIRPDNFSYDGLRALFDYLEQYEEDCDTEIELDVIAICCEYTEFADVEEYLNNYGTGLDKEDYLDHEEEFDEDAFNEDLEEEIQNKTQLIKLGDSLDEGFIILDY